MKKEPSNKEEMGFLEKNQLWFNKISIVLLTLSLILSTLVAVGVLPLENAPNTQAYETIERTDEHEIYEIVVYNFGKIAHNLKIVVSFPNNCSLSEIHEFGGELVKKNETINMKLGEYSVLFSSIQEGESVGLKFKFTNPDFINNKNLIITPWINIWTEEEGKVQII